MEYNFLQQEKVNFFNWFRNNISQIYGISDLPASVIELNDYQSNHIFIYASCDTEFDNYMEDPYLSDFCYSTLLIFKHESAQTPIKFRVKSMESKHFWKTVKANFYVHDEDPNRELWIEALKKIAPNIDKGQPELSLCSSSCKFLDEYWNKY